MATPEAPAGHLSPGQLRRLRCGNALTVGCVATIRGIVDENRWREAVALVAHRVFGGGEHTRDEGQETLTCGAATIHSRVTGQVAAVQLSAPAWQADATTLKLAVGWMAQACSGAAIPEVAVSPTDAASWLRGLTGAPEGAAAREFWRAQAVGWSEHPTGLWMASTSAVSLDVVSASIGGETLAALRKVAPAMKMVQAWLLTCWQLQVSTISGAADPIVAVGTDLRAAADELAMTPGALTEHVPVRLGIDRCALVAEAAAHTAARLAEAGSKAEWFSWQQCAGDADAAFPFGFDYADAGQPLGGAAAAIDLLSMANEPCLLRLSVTDHNATLTVGIWFDHDRITRAQAGDVLAGFTALVGAAAARPGTSLLELPAIGPRAYADVTENWAVGAVTPPAAATLTEMFAAQARQRPGATAVIAGERRLSYRELAEMASGIAGWLRAKGIARGSRVGILAHRAPETVASQLAVLALGACYVGLDPQYPADRLRHMCHDSQADLVIATRETTSIAAQWSVPVAMLPDPVPNASPFAPGEQTAADLAYLAYTSGSTGSPKGAGVTHGGAVNVVTWLRDALGFAEGDRVLHHSSISFDVSARELFAALVNGATAVLAPRDASRDPQALIDEINARQVTAVYLVSSLVGPVSSLAGFQGCASLRYMMCGAEPLSAAALVALQGTSAVQLVQLYGPCESTMNATAWRAAPGWGTRLPPIGRPLPNVVIRLLDKELMPVAPGVPADLYVGGVGVGHGYLWRPAVTAQRFVPDPLGGGRLYATGDIARWNSAGQLEFLGREDHQVKIRGVRVELEEIEAALERHDLISEAAVRAHRDDNSVHRLTAYIVAAGPAAPSSAQLRSHLHQTLPEAMIPSAFVMLDTLPRTPSGKIARSALAPPAPQTTALPGAVPRNTVERMLAEIWSEVLGQPTIGIHDNFFELGGDSILSILISARAANRGWHLAPTQFFEHQTIAELALIASEKHQSLSMPSHHELALTPIQRRFFAQQLTEPGHCHQGWLLEPLTPLDPVLLEQATVALLAHHDSLRATFHPDPDAPSRWRKTLVGEPGAAFRHVPERPQGSGWSELLTELQGPFDLTRAPLLRVVLAGRDRLLLIAHHLIVDAVSWRVILDDLRLAYRQLQQGQPVRLPSQGPLPSHWAHLLEQSLAAGRFSGDADYWASVSRKWPAGEDPAAVQANQVATAESWLSQAQTQTLLRDLPRHHRASINDALMMGLASVIGASSGADRVLVDVEGHGREAEGVGAIDLTRSIGWFTAIAPVSLQVPPPGQDAVTRLSAIKEQLRSVPRRGLGYGVLRYLGGADGAAVRQPHIRVNYLGQYAELDTHADISWRVAQEPLEHLSAANDTRPYTLDFLAVVVDSRLCVRLLYSVEHHDAPAAQALTDGLVAELGWLATSLGDAVARFTPSDFPLLQTDQGGLDAVVAQATKKAALNRRRIQETG